jgi:flagellar basal-body rod protein FlgC
MSQVFAALGVARSGMGAYKLWVDAVADNIANVDNVTSTDQPAFAARYIVAQAVDSGASGHAGGVAGRPGATDAIGDGVVVTGVVFGDPNGRVVYEPNNPLADDNGMVRRPDIDLADQMTYLQVAQRGYQANINVFERVRDSYEAALRIGN